MINDLTVGMSGSHFPDSRRHVTAFATYDIVWTLRLRIVGMQHCKGMGSSPYLVAIVLSNDGLLLLPHSCKHLNLSRMNFFNQIVLRFDNIILCSDDAISKVDAIL